MDAITSRDYLIFFVSCLLSVCPLSAFGQTSFNMTYKGGHYYINTTMNNHDNVEVFVESGLPGMLINENDYNTLFVDSLYQTVESGYSEIRFLHGTHSVHKIKYGKVFIGDLSYQGNIYIIDTYSKIGVPIHLLKNEKDSTANMARLNFGKRTLDFVGQDAVDRNNMYEYKMIESSPIPVIETTLFLADTYGHSGSIKGKFFFDLGNGSPLFLAIKNPSMLSFIKDNGFKIFPATDKSGNNVGYGIKAGYCKVGERTIKNVSIGCFNKNWMSAVLGCIGPSVFKKGYVIFDTEKGAIYYE